MAPEGRSVPADLLARYRLLALGRPPDPKGPVHQEAPADQRVPADLQARVCPHRLADLRYPPGLAAPVPLVALAILVGPAALATLVALLALLIPADLIALVAPLAPQSLSARAILADLITPVAPAAPQDLSAQAALGSLSARVNRPHRPGPQGRATHLRPVALANRPVRLDPVPPLAPEVQ